MGGPLGQPSPSPAVDPLPGPWPASPLGDVVRELRELRISVFPPCPVCEATPELRAFAARFVLEWDFGVGALLALILLLAFRCCYDLVRDVRSFRRTAFRPERRDIAGAPIRFGWWGKSATASRGR